MLWTSVLIIEQKGVVFLGMVNYVIVEAFDKVAKLQYCTHLSVERKKLEDHGWNMNFQAIIIQLFCRIQLPSEDAGPRWRFKVW
jgi:hypothetical protein